MPDINPALPVIGQPDSTEEPKVVTALSQLIAAVNDVDTDQISDGTITAADLAAVIQEALFAPGDLKITAHDTADSGWLLCDGATVSRATYAALFAKIGTAFGAGDGTTTFTLPDFRGRVPVGVDGGAGRVTANNALGAAAGEQTHTLSIAEMPSHTHLIPSTYASSAAGGGGNLGSAGTWNGLAGNTGAQGGSGAHNNMQPYQVVNYQIKT